MCVDKFVGEDQAFGEVFAAYLREIENIQGIDMNVIKFWVLLF
jgi:hypothetical protein